MTEQNIEGPGNPSLIDSSKKPLGRRIPPDTEHLALYPLTTDVEQAAADRAPISDDGTALVPVVAGTPWMTNFDRPEVVHTELHGTIYVIGRGKLGTERGGHCYALKNPRLHDPNGYWSFYNQRAEGACPGFGSSRALSWIRGMEFDAVWLYKQAQLVDDFADTPPEEGSTVRAALKVLQTQGPMRAGDSEPTFDLGIESYHWATSWDDVRSVLQVPDETPYVPFCNSWGEHGYPHVVFIHDDAGEAIFPQSEFGIMVPRA